MIRFLQVFFVMTRILGSQWGKKPLVWLGLWFGSSEQGTDQAGAEGPGRGGQTPQWKGWAWWKLPADPQKLTYRIL